MPNLYALKAFSLLPSICYVSTLVIRRELQRERTRSCTGLSGACSPHTKVTYTCRCFTLCSTFPLIFLLSVNKNVKLTETLLFLFPELSLLALPVRLPLCHLFVPGRNVSSCSWLPQLAVPCPFLPSHLSHF